MIESLLKRLSLNKIVVNNPREEALIIKQTELTNLSWMLIASSLSGADNEINHDLLIPTNIAIWQISLLLYLP